MSDIRALFCASVDAVGPLLAEPVLVDRFDGPSALAEFPVRGLAGHLLRATTSAEGYLDGPEPAGGAGVITAVQYYGAAMAAFAAGIDDPAAQAIRQRGLEAAPGPPEEFAKVWAEMADRFRARLAAEAPGRLVQVYGDMVLTLDEYLVTRLVELVVHADDLAASLGVAPPPLPTAATGRVIATLVDVARARHGDTAIVRALTRRERDTVEALRVI
jgi:uncharacterized protein (TIGR03083 family)